MTYRAYAAMFALVASGCSSKHEAAPASGSSTTATPRDDAAVPADAETVKQHMRGHFAAISELQRAIARGHLEEAKEQARLIADHTEPAHDAVWTPFLEDMSRAAREVIDAPDLPGAAVVASRLARACSACHDKTAAVIVFAWEEAPPATPDLATQMKRHQWAATRLWEGLVGPSDDVWHEGAKVLASTTLDTMAASRGVSRGDVPALAAHVRELAKRAMTTDDLDARAKLYGELLSTCAGCHALVRPAPVP